MTENAKRSLTIELMPAELGKIKVKMSTTRVALN